MRKVFAAGYLPVLMENGYYDPGEQRVAKVNALFERIAPRYDLINDIQSFALHRVWKRNLVSLARPGKSVRALDVCCGTGDIALAMARQGAKVTGLDFSPRMLEIARRRAKGCSAQFMQGDAQQLPFPNNSFEVITIGYGLRNLKDWRLGLAEMHRVAAPGGRILVLDFEKPKNRLLRTVYFGYLKLFVPVLGLLFTGSTKTYSYILESLKHYPAQEGVEAEMRRLGLERVDTVNLLGGIMSISYGEKGGSEGSPLPSGSRSGQNAA